MKNINNMCGISKESLECEYFTLYLIKQMEVMKIVKVKKKFDYKGIELRIVDREEPYLNAPEPLVMTRVIAPNGGMIPVNISRKQTLKSIVEDTISLLDDLSKRGANVEEELTKVI